MSNGSPRSSWEDIALDPDTLLGAVAEQTAAVEDAGGDVKAANERLRQEVIAAQEAVKSARERLDSRRQDVVENLNEMSLVGRAIEITAGTSLAAAFRDEDGLRSLEQTHPDPLRGTSGIITGLEVGTVFGEPVEPEKVVLHVDLLDPDGTGLTIPPSQIYAIDAAEADYRIGTIPQPEVPEL